MSRSPIPTMDDIRAKTNLPVFKVEGDLEWMDGPVLVRNNDLDSVTAFAEAVGAKVLLVQYDYPDFDDYFIDPEEYDLIDLFGEEMEDAILEAIEERNDEVEDYLEKEYDNEPIGCSVYVMYDGAPYGMFIEDDALIEEFGETNDEFIVRKYMDEE